MRDQSVLRWAVCGALLAFVTVFTAGPEFEVASLRPSADDARQAVVHIDGSHVRMTRISVKQFVGVAYRLKPHQVIGPDWLGQEHFDLAATIPDGVPATQVPEMLRALLANRFQMKLHEETKEFSVFAITIAKGGLKAQPSAPLPDSSKPRALDVTAGGSAAGASADLGNGASFSLANNRLEVKRLTMQGLAELLTRLCDRPVIDATGVKDPYDLDIELSPEDFTPIMIRAAVNNGTVLPAPALRLLDNAVSDPFSNGLQKVGLTLDSRKAPLDVVIVDSASKTPTEN